MATRFRKSRRQRGSRYCGWGQVGQHRQSGSRGGVGGAGKHKHFWIRTVIEEPDHFGHDPFNSFNRNLVQRWINIRGSISGAYMVKVDRVSESARSKIEAAGGGVIKDEQHDNN